MDSQILIQTLESAFQKSNVPLVCAYLFGSQARNQARADSDIDIAVLFDENASRGLLGALSVLRGDLERALQCEVDLIDMRAAPADLIHRVLRDGRLLMDRNPDERICFEVDARNRYFDLLPYLQRYRREQAA